MQLLDDEFDHACVVPWPDEAFVFEAFHEQPEALAFPAEDLDSVAAAVAKHVERAGEGIESEALHNQCGQVVDALAKVDRLS